MSWILGSSVNLPFTFLLDSMVLNPGCTWQSLHIYTVVGPKPQRLRFNWLGWSPDTAWQTIRLSVCTMTAAKPLDRPKGNTWTFWMVLNLGSTSLTRWALVWQPCWISWSMYCLTLLSFSLPLLPATLQLLLPYHCPLLRIWSTR